MTDAEYQTFQGEWISRFPFWKATPGTLDTLKSHFADFALAAAIKGLEEFARANPDLTPKTLRIGDVKRFAYNAAGGADGRFYWSPADESEWWSDSHYRRKRGLPELTFDYWCLYVAFKKRVPTSDERQRAAKWLKENGAKTPEQIEAQQDQNERSATRNRAQRRPEPVPGLIDESYVSRANRLAYEMATQQNDEVPNEPAVDPGF